MEIVEIPLLTEEGIPVRTLHIQNISMDITNNMLREHFRQFGAIERVQIQSERLKLSDILSAIGTTGFVDQPPSQRKYYAYVTFVNTLGASEALKSPRHVVQDREICIESAFTWNQPAAEVEKYLLKNQEPTSKRLQKLYDDISKGLNDDCILKIMSYLDISELAKMAKFSTDYHLLAQKVRTLRIEGHNRTVTIMELRNYLRLLGFGNSVTNLTISLNSFNPSVHHHICERLFQYIGPQFLSLTLKSFAVSSDQFDLLKPLLCQLCYLDIALKYDFDYRQFNCAFPNLKTLRIRAAGPIDTFISEEDTIPEFPALTTLKISTNHLHAHLFQRLHRACSNITELVVINRLTDLESSDLEHLSDFKGLVKLHLSLCRPQLIENIIDVVNRIKKLQHLTLEISKYDRMTMEIPKHWGMVNRLDDRLSANLNLNLKKIGISLPEIVEIRLMGIALEKDKLVQLIEYAPKLKSLGIHDCGLELTRQFIESIVTKRCALFETTRDYRTPTPLLLIVDKADYECSDFVAADGANLLTSPRIKQYLSVRFAESNNTNPYFDHDTYFP